MAMEILFMLSFSRCPCWQQNQQGHKRSSSHRRQPTANTAAGAVKLEAMVRVLSPIPVEKLKLLVFDLDGTLIDSAQDLCNSVNAALTEFGHAALPDPVVASFVGNGAPMLVRRALAAAAGIAVEAVEQKLQDEALAFFLKYYRAHKLDFTYAYEGVVEALAALKQLHDAPGTPQRLMAVLTNKPVRPAQGICEGLGMADYFTHIYGGDSFPAKKPDPMGLQSLMTEVGAAPEETVMIGDSRVDVQTARNAGAWAVGCAFGFGPQNLMDTPPDVVVDRAHEWITLLAPAIK
jgi:phosphoglycolate phosphatase